MTLTHIPTYIIIDIHIKFLAGNEFCVWFYFVDLNCIGVPISAQSDAGATLRSLNQLARLQAETPLSGNARGGYRVASHSGEDHRTP